MNDLQKSALAERQIPAPQTRDGSRKATGPAWRFNSHPSTDGHVHELGAAAARAKLRHAQEQLTYWQGARFCAGREQDKHAAGARVVIWEMQVRALKDRLQQLETA